MRQKRKYTKEERRQITDEVLAVKNIAEVAKKNNMPIGTIQTWMKNLKKTEQATATSDDYKKLKKLNEELRLENNILKDLLKKTVQVLT